MRHHDYAEEIMQLLLQLELELELDWTIKAFLGEEQECRKEVEEKLAYLQGFAEGLTLKLACRNIQLGN